MKKKFDFTCPNCHSEFTEVQDTEWYSEDVEIELCCTECHEVWRENFKLEYRGYEYKGISYDAEGEEN